MRSNRHSSVARTIVAAIGMCCLFGGAVAQTPLGAGDIAFTGYNSDNPDDFSFVLLKDVQAGTTITFTDRGWQAAGGFRPGESTIILTFAADRVTGEQFRVPFTTGIFLDFSGMSAGTSTGPNLNLTSSGDQLFAFQGPEPLDNSPGEQAKFIAALQMNGGWDGDATSDNTSALPPGLSDGVNALAIVPKVDNARYNCSITGPDAAALRAAIHNQANWQGNNNARFALPAPCDMTCGLGTDNRAPLVFCPFELEVFLDDACDYTIEDYRSSVFATDNCDPNFTLSQSPAPGDVVSGNTLITITARDVYDNTSTCSFQLFVTDDIAPQILNCPGDQTALAGQGCLFTLPDYTGMLTAFDNCDPNPEVMQNPVPGTQISQSTTIVLTVMDESGNSSQCSFQVILQDGTPPRVLCSVDRFAIAGVNCSFMLPDYRSQILVVDECDPTPEIIQSPAPGAVVYGDTWISFKISDASGNQESCGFNLYLQDLTPPTLQCQTQHAVALGNDCTAIMPDLRSTVTLNDNCDPNPTLTQIPAPGQPLTGNTFALFFAADASNNVNFCFAPVFVRDETPPTLVCRAPTLALGSNGNYDIQPADVIESMSDNCGPVTVLSIEPATLGCEDAGLTVPVTVTVRDAAGNTASCTTSASVSDVVNLPSAWTSTGIGTNGGSAVFRNCDESFILYSLGFSSGAADAIQFVHRTLCGDGEIIARVADVGPPGAAAGVMMRETLQPGSRKAALKLRSPAFLVREVRGAPNTPHNSQQFPNPNFHPWLRIVRQGNVFTGYSSANGTNWDFRFASTIAMAQCIHVGIFVESVNQAALASAVIDNVSFSGSSTPLWEGTPDLRATAQVETESMEVFPNPASGTTQLLWKGEFPQEGMQLTMMNGLGRVMWTRTWSADEGYALQIPLSGLPAGVYLIQATGERGARQTARIVVDR